MHMLLVISRCTRQASWRNYITPIDMLYTPQTLTGLQTLVQPTRLWLPFHAQSLFKYSRPKVQPSRTGQKCLPESDFPIIKNSQAKLKSTTLNTKPTEPRQSLSFRLQNSTTTTNILKRGGGVGGRVKPVNTSAHNKFGQKRQST